MKRGKNYKDSVKLYDKAQLFDPQEGVEICLKTAKAKFDETIELSVKLGVDPRHADQQVRGAVVLPHGTGKTVRVLVITKGDKVKLVCIDFEERFENPKGYKKIKIPATGSLLVEKDINAQQLKIE